MLPFVLYFVAGAVTGFQVYTLLSFAVYGAPINPLELVALLGSFCLLIAAYISLFKPHAAAKLALVSALAIWCFYGPAIAKVIRTRLENRSVLSRLYLLQPADRNDDVILKLSKAQGMLPQRDNAWF
ncbi:MAG: hypothetical protein WB660_31430 [Candidatus Sulfotelmatobacter sp.]